MDVSKKERIICGLDIGTTKVCMLIARRAGDGELEVVSTGYALSRGLKKGIVVDLDEAAASIRRAADEAELKSGVSVDWTIAGVSGDPMQSYNCHGAISIGGRHNEVTAQDISQVIQAAKSIPIPPGRDIIHILPQEYQLDNRRGIRNPVGLAGTRLDVDVHVVTCDEFIKQNLVQAVNLAQMRVSRLVLQQIASAEAVLTQDERELGVALIDVGGGTTDIALFERSAVRHTSVLPLGGDHFTRDLAVGLRTPLEDAERIKKETGSTIVEGVAEDEIIETPGIGSRSPRATPRLLVCQILRERALELLELTADEIAKSGIRDHIQSGVVLTGGGSLLQGMTGLAEEVLQMPVRTGLPLGVAGLTDELMHPVYATAVGLTLFEAHRTRDERYSLDNATAIPRFQNRILSWLGN